MSAAQETTKQTLGWEEMEGGRQGLALIALGLLYICLLQFRLAETVSSSEEFCSKELLPRQRPLPTWPLHAGSCAGSRLSPEVAPETSRAIVLCSAVIRRATIPKTHR